jgi:uncharacterized protein
MNAPATPATATLSNAKAEHLRSLLAAHAPLVIAYSGGVDSAYLLAEAHAVLGARVLAVIADSPSLPRQALRDALDLARHIGATVEVVATEEMEDTRYASNPANRCYFCKSELFTKLDSLARQRGYAAIAYGENADDVHQARPGRLAAEEFQIIAPLRDAGLTKQEIRELSHQLCLPTADAPSQPCLSSRIPHGTPVTPEALAKIERAEAYVRSLGFKVFRVRHIVTSDESRARLQVDPAEMWRIGGVREELLAGLLAAGYDAVEIDPAGYRSPSG